MTVCRARIRTARGDPGSAMAMLESLRADHRTRPTTDFLDGLVRAAQAEAAAAGDDWATVGQLMSEPGADDVAAAVLAGRRAAARGDHLTARQIMADPAHRPRLGRQLDRQIRRQLWLARAFQLTGQRVQAMAALRGALETARADGYRLPFVELGAHARPLPRMQVGAAADHRVALVERILAALPSAAPPAAAPGPAPVFTPREHDLLVVLPTRMSNEAIAHLLNVSTNTVKTHLRSVYRKLGVEDRGAAVERAERLGLLYATGGSSRVIPAG